LIKSVENAYRHVGISLANQLARAYPDIDMREVLKLVGTKWNVPTYYPSVGTGGYCIPVASQYVLAGTDHEEELTILDETVETDKQQPMIVADALAERGVSSVAILGLAYKGDLRVDVLTPTVPITSRLQEHGIDVSIHDPFYDDEYIEERTDAEGVEFPEGLAGKDAVLIVADHREYTYFPHGRVLDELDQCSAVVDNHRVWEDIPFDEHGIEYVYTGGEGWLTPVIGDRNAGSEAAARQFDAE
jgi:nucleotide sugar dehydrogenase